MNGRREVFILLSLLGIVFFCLFYLFNFHCFNSNIMEPNDGFYNNIDKISHLNNIEWDGIEGLFRMNKNIQLPLFFIHIPKTAGTSLYYVLSYHFKRQNLTSVQIWSHPSEASEFNKIENTSLVFGHFKYGIHNLYTRDLLSIRKSLCTVFNKNCSLISLSINEFFRTHKLSFSPSASPSPSRSFKPSLAINSTSTDRKLASDFFTTHKWISPSARPVYKSTTTIPPFEFTFHPTNFTGLPSLQTSAHNNNSISFTYAAFVREPLDRIVSHYYYRRSYFNDPFHKICTDYNISMAVEQIEDQDNAMTQFLGGRLGTPNSQTFEIAKNNVRNMDFVGIYEKIDESMVLLQYYLNAQDLLIRLPRKKVNAHKKRMNVNLTEEEKQNLSPYVKYDNILYEIALQKHEKMIENMGRSKFDYYLQKYKLLLPSLFPEDGGGRSGGNTNTGKRNSRGQSIDRVIPGRQWQDPDDEKMTLTRRVLALERELELYSNCTKKNMQNS